MSLQVPGGGEPAGGSSAGGRVILDDTGIDRAAKRIAHEIRERDDDLDQLVLVAIEKGGVPVAERIATHLRELRDGAEVEQGRIDVTLYRDDVIGHGRRPIPRPTRMPLSVGGKRVVLVDDVMFTGRTIRAAMDAVIDFGRPEAIQVAVLVDRGHRELPIRVDFVGKNIPTSRRDRIVLRETGSGGLEVVIE